MKKIKNIYVIGAGTMGSGIAQTAAVYGYQTTIMDIDPNALQKGQAAIARSAGKLLQKERISEEQYQAALKIKGSGSLQDSADADLVIEAATENPNLKEKIFAELGETATDKAILASNTSSISISRIAAVVKHPERVVGLHFFNPVPLMKLVEVIEGKQTEKETVEAAMEFARSLGKTPVLAKDSPGFIGNRILIPMINEAVYTLAEGVAPVESIDEVMKLGMGHPMGPLQLADLIGLDVVLDIMQVLHTEFASDKYRPAPLLEDMVADGNLGKKTGRGFYVYE
ncbi:MAG: 3-hydroxybutyryl-CoA dehydrogenase [Anaerolineales bacterium]|nr:3-hydroxybutyryl-CoA dehydrogenase [Anaerolineales bacterium]